MGMEYEGYRYEEGQWAWSMKGTGTRRESYGSYHAILSSEAIQSSISLVNSIYHYNNTRT